MWRIQRKALGGKKEVPDYWATTATGIGQAGRKVLFYFSGQRMDDKQM